MGMSVYSALRPVVKEGKKKEKEKKRKKITEKKSYCQENLHLYFLFHKKDFNDLMCAY